MSEIESINEMNADLFSPEEVDRFSDPKEARKKAMDYLARREYGQRELEQKLITAGFESVVVSETVDKLNGEGLQDDRRFIDNFAHSRINHLWVRPGTAMAATVSARARKMSASI